ncbi:MAG: type II toxin-antitoxin system RelE/ParE family toxin [Blautia sp.]|nr:type II toxin-antitoxin system RelE/ParE family toxin [Blautia sp.]
MAYRVMRTAKADELIHRIILFVAERFGRDTALEKMQELEKALFSLGDNPYIGVQPQYHFLRRQGYRVLILEKDLVFYKVDEHEKTVTIYAVTDQRQDYLGILRGL